VNTLDEYREALAAGADVIMLDNMGDEEMAQAVRERPESVLLEASGNITPERVPVLAEMGLDLVSMGVLTHSARASDISLDLEVDTDAQ
jgi:nicotinate-nucleotide pyrophosphorylase (carboxylating)